MHHQKRPSTATEENDSLRQLARRVASLEKMTRQLISMCANPKWIELSHRQFFSIFVKRMLLIKPLMQLRTIKKHLQTSHELKKYKEARHIWTDLARSVQKQMMKKRSLWSCSQALELLTGESIKNVTKNSLKKYAKYLKEDQQTDLYQKTEELVRRAFPKSGIKPSEPAVRWFQQQLWCSLDSHLHDVEQEYPFQDFTLKRKRKDESSSEAEGDHLHLEVGNTQNSFTVASF